MIDLTDRQRFALRESLLREISAFSEDVSCCGWDVQAVATCRMLVANSSPRTPVANTLVELLGEWPVGHRGEKGWEKLEASQ
jgi:hypothetical protein